MADYAGAVAAMRDLFVTEWAGATPVVFQNEEPPQEPWPPVDATGALPWCYFEVTTTSADLRGAGLPGSHVWLTTGYIYVHVFVPKGYGYPQSLSLADQAGEIFRARTLYQDGAGAKVVCMAPQTDGGAPDPYNGNQFRVTMAVKFEFYFLK